MRKKLSVLCTTFLLPLLMTVPTFAADSPFSDVAPDAPYAESIAYLVEHGITNGTGADTRDRLPMVGHAMPRLWIAH